MGFVEFLIIFLYYLERSITTSSISPYHWSLQNFLFSKMPFINTKAVSPVCRTSMTTKKYWPLFSQVFQASRAESGEYNWLLFVSLFLRSALLLVIGALLLFRHHISLRLVFFVNHYYSHPRTEASYWSYICSPVFRLPASLACRRSCYSARGWRILVSHFSLPLCFNFMGRYK